MSNKMIYEFGKKTDGDATMRALLGGKGANLAEMTNLGLPVPPGLTITTETCMAYINNGNKMPEGLMDEVNIEGFNKLYQAQNHYRYNEKTSSTGIGHIAGPSAFCGSERHS